jgi:hypothetical protein
MSNNSSSVVIMGDNDNYSVSVNNGKLIINNEEINYPHSLNGSISISQNNNELVVNGLKYNPKLKTFSQKKKYGFKIISLLLIALGILMIVDQFNIPL